MTYKVISAYATLRVPNDLGQEVLVGFYEGAVLPKNVNQDDLNRHLRKSMVKKADDPFPTPDPASGGGGDGDRPAGNASREVWAAYATAKGAPESETKPVDEGGLSHRDLRAKYGA